MKKKSKFKKLIIILVIIAVIVIVAVFALKKKFSSPVESQTAVQLEEIQKRDLSDFISLSGSVTGETKINYSSSAASEILKLNVQVGDEVKKGDVLATLDEEAIQSQIKSLEKAISNAAALSANQAKQNQKALDDAKKDQKKQLALAQEAISDAKDEYKSAQKEYSSLEKQLKNLDKKSESYAEEKAALTEQLKLAKEAVKTAKNAKEEAESSYDTVKETTDDAISMAQNTIDMEKYSSEEDDSSDMQLKELKKQLNNCTIKSKGNGIVTAVNVSVGDMNTPDTAIITVEDNTSMIMTASVSEKDILKLQEGMKAIVTADALEDQEINGEVIKVVKVFDGSAAPVENEYGEISAGNTEGGFSVQIRLEKSELISGMSAKAKIILTDKADILCVPYDLVLQDESGNSYVLCAEPEENGKYKAVKKNVQVGEEVNYYVEVTGGDVSEGDMIIMDYAIQEGDVFQADSSMNMSGAAMEMIE